MDNDQYIALRSQITALGVKGLARLTDTTMNAQVQGLNIEGLKSASCIVYILYRDGRVLSSPLIRISNGYTASMNILGRITAIAVVGMWKEKPEVLLLGCSTKICFDAAHIKTKILDRYVEPKPTTPIPQPMPIQPPATEEMPIEAPTAEEEEIPMPSPQGMLDSAETTQDIPVFSATKDAGDSLASATIETAEFIEASKPQKNSSTANSTLTVTFIEPDFKNRMPSEISEYNEDENIVQADTSKLAEPSSHRKGSIKATGPITLRREPIPPVPFPIPIPPLPAEPTYPYPIPGPSMVPSPSLCSQIPARFYQGVPTGRTLIDAFAQYPGADWAEYQTPSSEIYLFAGFVNPDVDCFAVSASEPLNPPVQIPSNSRYLIAQNGSGYWVFCSCP